MCSTSNKLSSFLTKGCGGSITILRTPGAGSFTTGKRQTIKKLLFLIICRCLDTDRTHRSGPFRIRAATGSAELSNFFASELFFPIKCLMRKKLYFCRPRDDLQDAEMYDRFCHKQDRAYTLPGINLSFVCQYTK